MKVESVWDYPRPPRLESVPVRIRVMHRGITVADTVAALRLLETSHSPVYYIPHEDAAADLLRHSASRSSFCEFKGLASYWDLVVRDPMIKSSTIDNVGWSYTRPVSAHAQIARHLAFYASKVDECWVGYERVAPQAGDFYGGWITTNLSGPFKGAPGTLGWQQSTRLIRYVHDLTYGCSCSVGGVAGQVSNNTTGTLVRKVTLVPEMLEFCFHY